MAVSPSTSPAKNEPFCGNCGYALTGLTESSKCPECGKPLVEVLTRPGQAFLNVGKRYQSKAMLFGWPVISIAMGPKDGELRGHAKGIIAIGDIATGGIAIGGIARGIVALGGVALGLFSLGGLSVGLISAVGGLAVGGLASGGGAVGLFAAGGGAVGIVAQGGGALGLFTRDARGVNPPGPTGQEPFTDLALFFGDSLTSPSAMWQPMLATFSLTVAVAVIIGLVAWLRLLREPGRQDADNWK
jgi:hypothetical protein